jgi:hypothetical protein
MAAALEAERWFRRGVFVGEGDSAMAHATSHHRNGTFWGFLLGAVFVLALVLGWMMFSGDRTNLASQGINLDLPLPKAPELPATPNPEPLPLPTPAKPG